jgi:hypothetical protein
MRLAESEIVDIAEWVSAYVRAVIKVEGLNVLKKAAWASDRRRHRHRIPLVTLA